MTPGIKCFAQVSSLWCIRLHIISDTRIRDHLHILISTDHPTTFPNTDLIAGDNNNKKRNKLTKQEYKTFFFHYTPLDRNICYTRETNGHVTIALNTHTPNIQHDSLNGFGKTTFFFKNIF